VKINIVKKMLVGLELKGKKREKERKKEKKLNCPL
jgi:hypothetical protein